MNSSLYIGATGMKGLAEGMQVTSNNLANISTIGFKQQNILFSTLMCQTQANMGEWWNNQEDSRVAVGQVQMGLQIEAVRTIYTQGPLESTNTLTDLAIDGKGFFQVTDGERLLYTRAGDFRPDNEGVWRTPSGLALNGYQLNPDGSQGALAQVRVDAFGTMAPKSTDSVELSMNFGNLQDNCASLENPYFSLLSQYNASTSQSLSNGSYSQSMAMTLYDANGAAHEVTAYFDGAPSSSTTRNVEFVIASDVERSLDADGNLVDIEPGAGLLMSGVLQFDSSGNLQNVSAFTPSRDGSKDLADWSAAELQDGKPTFMMDGSPVSLDFGLSGSGWDGETITAAEVGRDGTLLPGMQDSVRGADACTAYSARGISNDSYRQNGYAEGVLSNINITSDGTVVGYFSNGQYQDMWQIPVCRFTSEDGLYREGGNLFSHAEGAGEMEMGIAGTENYGDIRAYHIESSNVDMAQEMVNMIITQRGFQSNSKVVTTADQMLQKAMELKRQ